ncbi:hypothetical protein [Natronolimnohabitans innermongolicus]|uniref:Peptidase M50 n=1 Tax=Natronolimnohabitans innermongolicus JCM 12255 TaxID=1227499 RepID=L9XA14_9EURY|nr:hypothetical protein [Natronolimnohabitans innermongolicus]ELY57463.1 hypothetical protein C493_08256 [Natronolimnohabitans innermongolicus JCM 12255]
MIETDLLVAAPALAVAVVGGLIAHELAHAQVLRLFGIDHTISYFPRRTDAEGGLLSSPPLAVVQPHPTGRESPHALRAAALAPLLLAVPVFVTGLSGTVPADSPILLAIAVGWLACAIPSPQDFSVVFYAHRVLERHSLESSADATTNATASGSRAD